MATRHELFEPLAWGTLRAPLLPSDPVVDPLATPDARLAIEIASEALAADRERSARAGEASRGARRDERLARALRSYLTRMRYRCTPFGLCAGVAVVSWGSSTDLCLAASSPVAHLRSDMGWIAELVERIEADEGERRSLRWVVNPALVEQDGRVYLAEGAAGPLPRSGVSVLATGAVRAALECAARPAAYDEIVAAVMQRPAATRERAEKLTDELCRQSLLICELWAALHQPDPLQALTALVDATPGLSQAALRRSTAVLARQTASFSATPTVDTYRQAVGAARRILPGPAQAFQVDASWTLATAGISEQVAAEAARAAELLLRLGPLPAGPPHLVQWRRRLVERFGAETMVPVTLAVDPVLGIGPPSRNTGRPETHPERDACLRSLALEALRDKRTVVEIDDDLLDRLSVWSPADGPAPAGVDLIVGVAAASAAAVDRGQFTCVVTPTVGAPGAGKASGRFAHVLGPDGRAGLEQLVDDGLRAEVMFRPGVDRLLNVTAGTGHSGWVIPVGVPPPPAPARVLRPADLSVTAEEGRLRVVTGDGREVTPVATHMLSAFRTPELARLLLDVPRDGRPVLTRFYWGSVASLPVLPRLQRGRVVLSPANWRCDHREVSSDAGLDRWRDRWTPPAVCYLADGDNRLLVDLDDGDDRRRLLAVLARSRRPVQLDEPLPGPGDAWLPGPDGLRMVEVAVPLRRRAADPTPVRAATARRAWTAPDSQALAGDGWLYVKVYPEDEADEDRLLVEAVAPLVSSVEEQGLSQSWFFIRYHDPEPHLRLRWRQRPGREPDLALTVLGWAEGLRRSGRIKRFAADRYEREVGRYGGARGLELSERIFAADSRFVLDVLGAEAGGNLAGFADRTELAVVTLHGLVADLGVIPQDRPAFHHVAAGDGVSAGREYRKRKTRLRRLVGSGPEEGPLARLLAARSEVLSPAAAELGTLGSQLTTTLADVNHSSSHMHFNRLVGFDRPQECLVHGLLERTTRSLLSAPVQSLGTVSTPAILR